MLYICVYIPYFDNSDMKALTEQVIGQTFSLFRNQKVLLIKDLILTTRMSSRTIHRYLKKWKALSSYNFNGAYYTLVDLIEFDHNGLWIYNDIGFSKHGNLKSTIKKLIENSSSGLNLRELSALLKCTLHSLLPKMVQDNIISRVKHNGVYVYLESKQDLRNFQLIQLSKQEFKHQTAISSEIAIKILVLRLQYFDMNFQQFVDELHKHNVNQDASEILTFFEFHGLEKKTPILS